MNTGGAPCPTCNEPRFDLFQNKGLQQPLYGFRVFCSNKESGCDWQGELGQLDQHLNLNPDNDKLSVGCAYTEVMCLYCNEPHPRHEIKYHQTSQCAERPFTCSLCEYESTYNDVVTNHSPVCKCRPVDCPNSCGITYVQNHYLEEHVSTQCPLTYVECEFSDAGCDAKVYRKDLPSHLGENMVTHMSLLARENRKLKQQLREEATKLQLQHEEHQAQLKEHQAQLEEQEAQSKEREVLVTRENESLKQELEYWKEEYCKEQHEVLATRENESLKQELKYRKEQIEAVRRQRDDQGFAACVPPMVLCPDLRAIEPGEAWRSKAFYSGIAGYKLQFEVQLVSRDTTGFIRKYMYESKCIVLDSEFVIPSSGSLQITSRFKFGGMILCTDKHKIPRGRKESDPVSTRFSWYRIAELTQLVFQVIRTECLV